MSRRNKKQIFTNVTVIDAGAKGKTVAKAPDGRVIFLTNAVPGDVVDVRLSKNKKDWAEGKAIRILEFSKERVAPFCAHFGVCGGCKWQMLPYAKQLEYKQEEVVQQMFVEEPERQLSLFEEVDDE